jgi:hypothetical protein
MKIVLAADSFTTFEATGAGTGAGRALPASPLIYLERSLANSWIPTPQARGRPPTTRSGLSSAGTSTPTI